MALWKQITHLVKDPPPDHIFELSEAGIAYARQRGNRFPDVRARSAGGIAGGRQPPAARRSGVGARAHRAAQWSQAASRGHDSAGLRRARQLARFRFFPLIARGTTAAGAVPGEKDDSVRYRFGRGELLGAAGLNQSWREEGRRGRGHRVARDSGPLRSHFPGRQPSSRRGHHVRTGRAESVQREAAWP